MAAQKSWSTRKRPAYALVARMMDRVSTGRENHDRMRHPGPGRSRRFVEYSWIALGILVVALACVERWWGVDLRIPCLWRSVWDVPCLGCGATRFVGLCAGGELTAALEAYPQAWIVLPAAIWVLVRVVRGPGATNSARVVRR